MPSEHPVRVHPAAAAEFVDASVWYEERSPAVSARFDAEVYRAFARIADDPSLWPPHGPKHRHFVLRGFPFLVVYLITDTGPIVLAVAHASRHEEYWRDRNPEDAGLVDR